MHGRESKHLLLERKNYNAERKASNVRKEEQMEEE
jgi:hypothetical protein